VYKDIQLSLPNNRTQDYVQEQKRNILFTYLKKILNFCKMALLTYPNAYPFPYWEPYPTTFLNETAPMEGSRHHHIAPPHWGEKVAKMLHDKDTDVHKPRADVRETSSLFHIDVELPGLRDKSDLTLKWLSTRTILVSCRIRREAASSSEEEGHNNGANNDGPEISRKKAAVIQKIDVSTAEGKSRGEDAADTTAVPHDKESHQEQHHSTSPHLTVAERNIGLSTRAFNFPCDIDRSRTKAKLSAGLLTLDVPKQHHESGSHPEIEIQFDGH
jgi:HSP20 family molecular chaperone IbpA